MQRAAGIVADAHVHFYSVFDVGRAVSALSGNLAALAAPGATRVGLLADAGEPVGFARLADKAPQSVGASLDVTAGPEDGSLRVTGADGDTLYLIAGRQLVTDERLEVLGLAMRGTVPAGLSAAETIRAVREGGGVPVLTWAPGKWSGRRGRVVRALLERSEPAELLLGDPLMRAWGLPEPRVFGAARLRGFRVVAGSDPLPLRREERWLGRYATALDGAFDPARPVSSVRTLLLDPGVPLRPVGRRCSVLTMLLRTFRLYVRRSHS